MHNDPTDTQDTTSLLNTASRIESSLTDINARIARLAHTLNASLATEEDIAKILNRDNPYLEPHAAQIASNSFDQHEHRLVHQWEELRGLLVLRGDMMARSIQDLGLDATLKMTFHMEKHLIREGFEPGADGFDMLRGLSV
jgi:hypothetical protein